MQNEDRIKELEEELTKTKYNKRTAKHIGLVKAKIAKLKAEDIVTSKKQARHIGFAVKKTGDATAVLFGLPSVGKSTLLNQLTNADSKVGGYDFTTLNVIPGMLQYKGALIQLLDIPGVVEGAAKGKGGGKRVMGILRVADLIVILVDDLSQLDPLKKELYDAGIRLGEKPPAVSIQKQPCGGLSILLSSQVKFSEEEAKAVLTEYGVLNAEVIVRGRVTVDMFIDVLEGNRRYIPGLVVLNKSDLAKNKEKKGDFICVSAKNNSNIDVLREKIFQVLDFKRIYLKKLKNPPDMTDPLVLRGCSTVLDACASLHMEFKERFEYGRVWGKSAKFAGQTVGAKHKLKDEDVLELHFKR